MLLMHKSLRYFQLNPRNYYEILIAHLCDAFLKFILMFVNSIPATVKCRIVENLKHQARAVIVNPFKAVFLWIFLHSISLSLFLAFFLMNKNKFHYSTTTTNFIAFPFVRHICGTHIFLLVFPTSTTFFFIDIMSHEPAVELRNPVGIDVFLLLFFFRLVLSSLTNLQGNFFILTLKLLELADGVRLADRNRKKTTH